MSKKIAQTIKKLRLENGFSQQYLADQLKMSRPTYIQLEKGERELTVSEAEILASLFSLSLEHFLKGETAISAVELEKEKKSLKKKQEMRISVPQKNIKKFKEVLLYILEKVGARPNIGETALYKLLYFIDFDYYEKYEEQLIGATYIKNKYGPTPKEFGKIVESMEAENEIERVRSKYFQYDQKKYLPKRAPDLTVLSAQELVLIDNVLNRLAEKSAKELSDYSHGDLPWRTHDFGEELSYESVFYRDDKYSVREYEDAL